jgi:NAD(P) transhydrogenase subunit alpha
MHLYLPRQPATESRVALTPDVVDLLVQQGHEVTIDPGVGRRAGFADEAYTASGAKLTRDDDTDDDTGDRGWAADLVVTFNDVERAPSGALLGLLDPFGRPARMAELASAHTTVFAFEAVPRTTRAQVVDALSSQATAAGYQAVLMAAAASDRFFPMLTTAAGTIRPAKVVVLGAGVAGLQAIATARRLGAVVAAFDVRAAAAEQVESIGARFITIDDEPSDASDAGGYATALADDAQQRIIDGLAPHVADADVVITTAAIPGRSAPILVDAAGLARMRPGAVIVDVVAAMGGNTTATEPGVTVEVGGVTIIGATDLASGVAADASRMYAKNVKAFVDLVGDDDGAFSPDWDDDIVAGSCIARDGRLVHPRLTELPT